MSYLKQKWTDLKNFDYVFVLVFLIIVLSLIGMITLGSWIFGTLWGPDVLAWGINFYGLHYIEGGIAGMLIWGIAIFIIIDYKDFKGTQKYKQKFDSLQPKVERKKE